MYILRWKKEDVKNGLLDPVFLLVYTKWKVNYTDSNLTKLNIKWNLVITQP